MCFYRLRAFVHILFRSADLPLKFTLNCTNNKFSLAFKAVLNPEFIGLIYLLLFYSIYFQLSKVIFYL